MQERADNLFSPFKREPGQTRWLVRFGLAVPIVILLWNIVGGMFLDEIIIGVGLLLGIFVYGIGLAIQIVRIMSASERWGVESALNARRVSSRVQTRGDLIDETVIRESATINFQHAQFLRRLSEDVVASRRDGSHVSVIWLDVSVPGMNPYPAQTEKMAVDVAELLASQSKTIGATLNLSLNEYVFSLPQHDRAAAHAFMRKLLLGLGKYWCHCGIAEYPTDGTDAESVFQKARERCDASREGSEEPSPSRAG